MNCKICDLTNDELWELNEYYSNGAPLLDVKEYLNKRYKIKATVKEIETHLEEHKILEQLSLKLESYEELKEYCNDEQTKKDKKIVFEILSHKLAEAIIYQSQQVTNEFKRYTSGEKQICPKADLEALKSLTNLYALASART